MGETGKSLCSIVARISALLALLGACFAILDAVLAVSDEVVALFALVAFVGTMVSDPSEPLYPKTIILVLCICEQIISHFGDILQLQSFRNSTIVDY